MASQRIHKTSHFTTNIHQKKQAPYFRAPRCVVSISKTYDLFYSLLRMPFFSLRTLAIGVLAVLSGLTTAETDEKATRIPCTIRSPNTGVFYDLRSLSIPLPDPDKKPKSGARTESWSVRGWNYNANFTMNICTPVIEEVKEVDGIKEAQWRNVSAFYKKSGKTFSIG